MVHPCIMLLTKRTPVIYTSPESGMKEFIIYLDYKNVVKSHGK